MLDNPNLGMDSMLELLAQGKSLVSFSLLILILLLLYVYRYQIRLFIKYGLKNKDNKNSTSNLTTLITKGINADFKELEKQAIDDRVNKILKNADTILLDESELNLNVDESSNLGNIKHKP